jgi:hypothetical protein
LVTGIAAMIKLFHPQITIHLDTENAALSVAGGSSISLTASV